MHVKSPNIVTRLTEQSKSVSFSDDNAASGEEDTSNKEKTGSMRSEVLGRKIEHSDGRVSDNASVDVHESVKMAEDFQILRGHKFVILLRQYTQRKNNSRNAESCNARSVH